MQFIMDWIRQCPMDFDLDDLQDPADDQQLRSEILENLLDSVATDTNNGLDVLVRRVTSALHDSRNRTLPAFSGTFSRRSNETSSTGGSDSSFGLRRSSATPSNTSPEATSPSTSTSLNRHTNLGIPSYLGKQSFSTLLNINTSAASLSSRPLSTALLSLDPEMIAQELALIDAEAYNTVHPRELLDQTYNSVGTRRNLAPGVVETVERFNFVANLVVTAVMSCKVPKARADLIVQFVRVAKHSVDIHSYNSGHAIVSSLTSAALYRLTKTWAKVPPTTLKTFENLKSLFAPYKNWAALRNRLSSIDSQTPCIPWLGMFLRDMVTIEELYPRYIETDRKQANIDGLNEDQTINFVRCRWLWRTQIEALRFQEAFRLSSEGTTRPSLDESISDTTSINASTCGYPFKVNERVRSLLTEERGLLKSPSKQFEASLKIEPRQKGSKPVVGANVKPRIPKTVHESGPLAADNDRQGWAEKLLNAI
jgi:hypothetical protein